MKHNTFEFGCQQVWGKDNTDYEEIMAKSKPNFHSILSEMVKINKL